MTRRFLIAVLVLSPAAFVTGGLLADRYAEWAATASVRTVVRTIMVRPLPYPHKPALAEPTGAVKGFDYRIIPENPGVY